MIYRKPLNIGVSQDTIEKIKELRTAQAEYRDLAGKMGGNIPDTSKVEDLEREVILRLGSHALDAVDNAGKDFLRFP